MSNYIELNGEKSTNVNGLLIQSLPPITKPKMRTSAEEIDGRDGDIVTKLGYSAYNKTLKIGLHGDYDVDDAISFFDSEGEVVFSNEPDKYYRYEIIDGIDFDRLIRFRTASVNLHVQPFKYDAVDRVLNVINQLVHIGDYGSKKFGVSVASKDGKITVAGKATSTVEFYIPIESFALKSGSYTLSASVVGSAGGSAIRLVDDSPSDLTSFGRNYISLKDGTSSVIKSYETGALEYDYLWLYVPSGALVNFELSVNLGNDDFDFVEIVNRGNVESRPKITLHGSGNVALSLNGLSVISLNINDYITIDVDGMNAYRDGVLMNRSVKGDYANLAFRRGTNTLSWDGSITEINVEDFSRWI